MPKKAFTKADVKAEINRWLDEQRSALVDLSIKIHDNPEPGFKEEKASGWLTDYLAKNGFRVEKGVGGLPTAFRATYGSDKPVIALLAEYDALPELGHACGHNIIAASSTGAAVASKLAVDRYDGAVVVFGTPAEELFGGKIYLLQAGVFEGIDAAMIVHPGVRDSATNSALACIGINLQFFGKAAHAAAFPEQGINALEAMILAFNAVDSLRQHIQEKARVHGIITNGGESPNIVPAHTAASFLVRAQDLEYLNELKKKFLKCFEGAAMATGARLEYKWDDVVYEPMKRNLVLARLFAQNLESLGRRVDPLESYFGFGSTDVGNVSQVVPAIHPSMAITTPNVLLHSAEFVQAAVSEAGHSGLLDAAKAMAMTVTDLLAEPENMASAKAEFYSSKQ
ncbi:MAG TPA: M20 family metallopeptidase [Dehalococcoidia bacterium]